MLKLTHLVRINPRRITLDGQNLPLEGEGMALLNAVYRQYVGDWPKYFKMDALCRLGLVGSDLLCKGEDKSEPREDTAVILFNRAGSLCNDSHYQETIRDAENYFPSPSVFVYTLANIVTGEICIRHKFEGESAFYVLDYFDYNIISETVKQSFSDRNTKRAVCGWIECENDNKFNVLMALVEQTK